MNGTGTPAPHYSLESEQENSGLGIWLFEDPRAGIMRLSPADSPSLRPGRLPSSLSGNRTRIAVKGNGAILLRFMAI
jgi:hypothetical protein